MFTGIPVNSKFCGCDYVLGQIYALKGLTVYLGWVSGFSGVCVCHGASLCIDGRICAFGWSSVHAWADLGVKAVCVCCRETLCAMGGLACVSRGESA